MADARLVAGLALLAGLAAAVALGPWLWPLDPTFIDPDPVRMLAARNLLAPDDAGTLLRLALAQLRSGKPARALDTLDQRALLGALDAPFHLARAQALHALQRNKEAGSAMRAWLAVRGSAPRDTHPGPRGPADAAAPAQLPAT